MWPWLDVLVCDSVVTNYLIFQKNFIPWPHEAPGHALAEVPQRCYAGGQGGGCSKGNSCYLMFDFQVNTNLAPNLSLSIAGTSFKVQPLVEYLFLGLFAPSLGE